MRYRFVFIVAFSLLLLMMMPATPRSSHAQSPTWPPANPFGVDMRVTIDETQGLSYAAASGAKWIRVKLAWQWLEPRGPLAPDEYDWSFYDAIFGNAAAAGMNLLVTIRDNPPWAAQYVCGPLYRPEDLARFAYNVVSRYKNPPWNIKVWELYNEPDNKFTYDWYLNLGGCWGNHGAEYARMLSLVYPAIKAADPEAIVVLGGLGFESNRYIQHLNPDFLDTVLRNGGAPYFDLVNFHYFREYDQFWPPNANGRSGMLAKLDEIWTIMGRHGVRKRFVITELGHPYAGPPAEGYSHRSNTQFVIIGNVRAIAEQANREPEKRVDLMIWYQMVDGPFDERKYGLLNSELQPQPGYQVYTLLIQEIGGATFQGFYRLPEPELLYGLEAYRFTKDGRNKIVAWCRHGGVIAPYFYASRIRLLSRTCSDTDCSPYQEQWIDDGELGKDLDGARNGKITLLVGPDPVFVEDLSPTPTPSRTPTATVTRTPTPTPTFTRTATATPTSTPIPPCEIVHLEAEAGIITPPMVVVSTSDESVSSCSYVHTPAGYGASGDVTFNVHIAMAGPYVIWARAWGLDGGSNSFWVSVDGAPEVRWDVPIGSWQWQKVVDAATGAPIVVTFNAGSHTIRFRTREPLTRLDAIEVAQNLPGCQWLYVQPCMPTPTITHTPTWTPTSTDPPTPTETPTSTLTATPTSTDTPTVTTPPVMTVTPTPSPTHNSCNAWLPLIVKTYSETYGWPEGRQGRFRARL